MEELLALKADILCEGHFGIYRTPQKVKTYIEQYMKQYLSQIHSHVLSDRSEIDDSGITIVSHPTR